MTPWDQRAARFLVRALGPTTITPNQITAASLAMALAGAGLLATGDATAAGWGAGLFALARFVDHLDGELARATGSTSRFGYYLDYLAGGLSYAALFLGIGAGLAHGAMGGWALTLGVVGAAAALLSLGLNLGIDRAAGGDDAVGYPRLGGFELEDGIYLIAPVTWLGLLQPFFVMAGLGAALYTLWTLATWLRVRAGTRGGAA